MSAPRILLGTTLSPHSGYGNDGIGIARALIADGWDVTIRPTGVQVPLPADIASLLTKAIEPPYDVMLDHDAPSNLGIIEPRKGLAPVRVAWTMTESTGMWGDVYWGNFQNYSGVVAYDDWTVDSVSSLYKGPITKLQGGFAFDDWQSEVTPPKLEPFTFLMVGSMGVRKNPFAAIRAMEKAQTMTDVPMQLILKDSHGVMHPAMQQTWPFVHIISTNYSPVELRTLYQVSHCLLAPSHGEGKNLPALEAQAVGTPVIASDCAGHREWNDPEWGWVTPGTMVQSPDTTGEWLKVNEDVLASQIVEAAENPGATARKGALAQRMVSHHDWLPVIRNLRLKLREFPADYTPGF